MFRDGSQVIDAKNFLIEQPECSYVTLEGQNYIGKYASQVSNISYILVINLLFFK
jgi:hypothetical protein